MKPQNKDFSLGNGFCLDMTFSLLVKWKHHWICEAQNFKVNESDTYETGVN